MNFALMKEVKVVRAHIQPRNGMTQRFDDVTKRLNNNAALQMPWRTDGKHCRNRFRLLFDKWVSLHATAAVALG